EPGKQVAGIVDDELGRAELTAVGSRHHPVAELQEHAHAVANPQERHGHVEHPRVEHRRPLGVHTGRPPGEDDPPRAQLADTVEREVVRVDLAIDLRLAHPPGDQLRVLAAEVEDENHTDGPLATLALWHLAYGSLRLIACAFCHKPYATSYKPFIPAG